MEDRVLVEALRSRDLGAIGDLYDAYAERLYAYCWFRLRSRDTAQVALRDTFIVAEAHIGKLRDAQDLAPWIYAVARMECARRLPVLSRRPDIPIASHDQHDVDRRVIAWRSVTAIDPLSQELLDLSERHGFAPAQIAAVLGLPVKAVPDLLDQARTELDAALTAELLAHDGPYGCPARATLLQQRRGELTHELRTKLLRHARECRACGAPSTANRPATSPAKVYALLPHAQPPSSLRTRVFACITDPDLASYRRFVAARQDTWHPTGFPAPAPATPKPSKLRAFRTNRQTAPRAAVEAERHTDEETTGTGLSGFAVASDFSASARPWSASDRRTASEGASAKEGAAFLESPSTAADTDRAASEPVLAEDRHGGSARRRVGKTSAVVVAVLVGVGAAGLGVSRLVAGARLDGRVAASGERKGGSKPRFGAPSPTPVGDRRDWPASVPISPTFPLGATGSAAPPTALPSPPSRVYQYGPGSPGGVGVLLVSPLFLDLGTGSSGTIRLQANGGPLTWQADVQGPIRLSMSAGRIDDGQCVTLEVTVFRAPGSHGQESITFKPGGQPVTVTWREQPPSPSPSAPPPSPPTSQPPPPPSKSSPPDSPPPTQAPSPGPDPTPAPPPSGRPSGPAPKPSA